jgi:hypothetical protein
MSMKRRAYACVNRTVAGIRQQRYEQQIRYFALDHGLDLARTFVDTDGRAIDQLASVVSRADARCVILVPDDKHLSANQVSYLHRFADIVEIGPGRPHSLVAEEYESSW